MRILSLIVFMMAITVAPRAFADLLGCGDTTISPDQSIPDDMTVPRDLSPPRDLHQRDARRERRRAAGRGTLAVSAVSAVALVAVRRRRRGGA
jgi:hypothetical protein